MPACFTCQHDKSLSTSHFYVPSCQRTIRHVNVQTAGQFFNWACQRVKRCANEPKGKPISQTFLIRNANGNFYTSLSEKFCIIVDIIVYIYLYVSYIKIVLYFISILYVILKKSVWSFSFLH